MLLVEMVGIADPFCFTMTKWLQLVGLDSNFKSLKVRPVRLSWFWQRTLESVLHLDSGSQVSVILILPKTPRPILHQPQKVNLTCNVVFVRDPETLSLHVSLSDSQKSVLGGWIGPPSLVPCMATMKLVHVTSTLNKKDRNDSGQSLITWYFWSFRDWWCVFRWQLIKHVPWLWKLKLQVPRSSNMAVANLGAFWSRLSWQWYKEIHLTELRGTIETTSQGFKAKGHFCSPRGLFSEDAVFARTSWNCVLLESTHILLRL